MTIFRYSVTIGLYFPLAWLGVYLGPYGALASLLGIFAVQYLLDHSSMRPMFKNYRLARQGPSRAASLRASKLQAIAAKAILYLHVPCTVLLLVLMFWKG